MEKDLSKKSNWINKRIISLVLLFFVLSGTLLPNFTYAFKLASIESFNCSASVGAMVTGALQSIWDNGKWLNPGYWAYRQGKWVFDEISENSPPPAEQPSNIQNCSNYITTYVISWLGYGVASLGEHLAYAFAYIFNFTAAELIVDQDNRWAITNPTPGNFAAPTFIEAWGIVKEWANILIVLGFIVIALAYILNFDQYKKLLAPLLVAALLINFSNVFVGLVIDASNIVMTNLLGVNTGEIGLDLIYEINGVWNNSLRLYPINGVADALAHFALSFWFGSIYVAVGITLLLFAIIFIARYVMLAIIFIFSPMAFALYVFPMPKAKQFANDWFNNLIKWCFMGLIGAFFLRLAMGVLKSFEKFFTVVPTSLFGSGESQLLGSIADMSFSLLIVLLFLWVGIRYTLKAAGPLTSLVLGAVTAIVAAVVSGGSSLVGTIGGGALKMAGKATGTSGGLTNMKNKVGDWASDKYQRTKEGLGLAPPGSSGPHSSDSIERRKARISKATEAVAEKANLGQLRIGATSGSMADRAIYQKKLAEKGEFSSVISVKGATESDASYKNRLDEGQRLAMQNMISHGMPVKEVIEKDPRLAKYDTLAFDDMKRKNPTWNNVKVGDELTKKSYQKSGTSNIREMSKDAIGDIRFLENTTAKRLREAGKDLSFDRKAALRSKLVGGASSELGTLLLQYKTARNDARARGDTDRANRYNQKLRELRAIWTEIASL